jgi:DNA-directed RNA polymerase specialized sigma24 family protein
MLYICEEPISEIARLIDISEDMVKQRLNEAASTVNL